MELIKGTATKIRFSTEVSGGKNNTSTSQIAIFELDGKPVEIRLPDSIVINNGDTIAVSGKFKRGIFQAMAYKNLTKDVSGKGQVFLYLILGLIFTLIGISIITSTVGLIFTPLGIYMIYHSWQLTKAYQMVTKCF